MDNSPTEHLTRMNEVNIDLQKEIAEQEKADDELCESERIFRHILGNVSLVAIGMDMDGRLVFSNDYFQKLVGYRVEEIQGLDWFETFLPTDIRNTLRQVFAASLSDGEIPAHYEHDIITRRGERRSISWNNLVMWDLQGNPTGMTSIGQDITDRKRAEERLRKAYAETEQLISSISFLLIGISGEDRVKRWNSAAEKTFSLDQSTVIGKPLGECGIHWNWQTVLNGIARCRRKSASLRLDDIRYTRRDGKEGFLNLTLNPIEGGDDGPHGLLLLGRDTTERKILQSQLAQAQKLESIGQLAAGIAHEINTPTQYVGDNTRFLQDAFADLLQVLKKCTGAIDRLRAGASPDEIVLETENAAREADLDYLTREIPKAIDQSLEGIERVSKIVRAMKEFSHPGTDSKTAIDINKAIESTITVTKNEWKYVAEMVASLDATIPLVPCLPAELNQVILNLIINAAHAISDVVGDGSNGKGTITIGTRGNGDSVEIRIGDTGTGIPEEIRSRVFDPFFTTKQVGRGTGQGLAIAHSVVVDKHGGTIRFETEMGKGTTLIVNLPCVGAP
jgi:PAS domain S-box-containing protein